MKKIKLTKYLLAIAVLAILFLVTTEGVYAQTATTSASPTPTATASALPDAGISFPTIFGMAAGLVAILLSLALAF